jgi:hypothetical protein
MKRLAKLVVGLFFFKLILLLLAKGFILEASDRIFSNE